MLLLCTSSNLCVHCNSDALFDASQYAFFGQDLVEEMELGGLEDGEGDFPFFGPADDEYHLFDREEVCEQLLHFLFSLTGGQT